MDKTNQTSDANSVVEQCQTGIDKFVERLEKAYDVEQGSLSKDVILLGALLQYMHKFLQVFYDQRMAHEVCAAIHLLENNNNATLFEDESKEVEAARTVLKAFFGGISGLIGGLGVLFRRKNLIGNIGEVTIQEIFNVTEDGIENLSSHVPVKVFLKSTLDAMIAHEDPETPEEVESPPKDSTECNPEPELKLVTE